jgi:hypothetical protein
VWADGVVDRSASGVERVPESRLNARAKVTIEWAVVGKVTIEWAVVGKVAVSLHLQHSVKEEVGMTALVYEGSDEQVVVAEQAGNVNWWPRSLSRSLLTVTAILAEAHSHVLPPMSCGCAVTNTWTITLCRD